MGFILDFQFLDIFNLFVLGLWFVLSPYTGTSTPSTATGARWGNTSIPYVIMVIVTIIMFIADVVFLAGGHAH